MKSMLKSQNVEGAESPRTLTGRKSKKLLKPTGIPKAAAPLPPKSPSPGGEKLIRKSPPPFV